MGNDSFDEGLRLIQHLGGAERPAVLDLFASLGEAEFGEQCVGFIYGDVYHRPGLALPERQLATVGALTALGYAVSQLQFHAKAALKAGCSRRQVLEAVNEVGSVAETAGALAAVEEAFAGTADDSGEQLSPKQREIVMIAACTALGTVAPELKARLHALLDVGGTRQELVETVLHLAFYAGFPAALNAMGVAKEVLAGR